MKFWTLGATFAVLGNVGNGQVQKDSGAAADYAKEDFAVLNKVAHQCAVYVSQLVKQVDDKLVWEASPRALEQFVAQNVLMDVDIYGSAIAFEPNVYNLTNMAELAEGVPTNDGDEHPASFFQPTPGTNLYCPYSWNCTGESISSCGTMDLAYAYDYLEDGTDWYLVPREMFYEDYAAGKRTYRGYWTVPYFDEGAGNVNMVTYSYPISYEGQFLGVATIDILVEKLCYGLTCQDRVAQVKLVQGLCTAMIVINVSLAFFSAAWVIVNRHHPVIRASQKYFLLGISFGTFVSTMTIYANTLDDTFGTPATLEGGNTEADFGCNLQVWFYAIGFVLSLAPLWVKLYRCRTIFINSQMKLKRDKGFIMTNAGGIISVFMIVLVDIILLSLWTSTNPLVYARENVNAAYCRSDNSSTFLGLIGGYHAMLLVVGCTLAYQCRNINDVFSEAKYVGICIVSNLQVLLLGSCVLALIYEDPIRSMFVRSGIIFLNDLSVQCFIFGPKLMYWKMGINHDDGKLGTSVLSSLTGKKANSNSIGTTAVAPTQMVSEN